ncbi:MAG: MopE-related protein, partial [Flavobacteriales bacterium]
NASVTTTACSAPTGYVSNSTDCNDNNSAIRPNATETCNGIDDNCNNSIDEGVLTTFYQDSDGDGYGNASVTTTACSAPTGYVSNSTDCNDNNSAIRPNATETCNGIDDNCNSSIDEGVLITFYRDQDGDGYGNASVTTTACSAPTGYVSNSTDCNDNNSAIRPNATETCNGVDDNCNSSIDEGVLITFYRDQDGDGYGNASVTTTACSAPTGYVSNSTDCNDNSSSINPAAVEICSNSVDDNCNNQINENCCSLVLSAIVSNTLCTAAANGSIDLSVSGGTTYSYSWSNGATTQDILNLSAGTYTVTVTSGSCSQTGTYTVGNSNSTGPAAPTSISGPAGVCRNSTGQVFSTPAISGATSYTWTLPNGASGTSTTNTITLSFANNYNTGNLCVRAVNACGQSASFCRSVTAYTSNPATPGTISGPSTSVCAGTTQTYSIASVTNATSYSWTAPTNATIASGQGTTTVTVSYSSAFTSGTLSVRSVNCFGQSSNRTLTVYSIPATPGAITGSANNLCPGSYTYSIAAVAGATSYTWTAPLNTTIASGQGTTSISLTVSSAFTSGTLSVTANSNCGQSALRSLTISKSPATPSTISGQTSNLCGGGQKTYSITAVTGATSYSWSVPADCSIVSNTGTSITLSIPSSFTSGTLSVTVTNSCGATSSRSTTLTAVPAPPASISGPASAGPSQTGLVFTTPAVTGLTQSWAVPTGAVITAGQGTTSMTCTWGTTSGNVSVRNVNSCGQSTAFTKSVA